MGGRAQNEIEIFLPVMDKIAHLMIDTETDRSLFDVTPEQCTAAQEIENDSPTSDFGVMIAPRMVLPAIALSVHACRL
jgi:hypothetical protein